MKLKIPSYITIFFILSVVIFCFYVFSNGDISVIFHPITISIIILSLLLLLIIDALKKLIEDQKLKTLPQEEREKILEQKKGNYFLKLYRSAFYPIDEENVKKIDHGFDEIIELDNRLPGWWVSLFYLTIMFSAIYFVAYIFTDFANPEKEYQKAYQHQLQEILAYEKERPQATIDTAYFNESFIEQGKELFVENCATCHGANGEGNIGPNLTDDYWINAPEKTLFRSIFYMIWYGSPNNPTMRAFGELGEIKGNDIEKITSYVYSINQNPTKPKNGKAPEGKLVKWEEEKNDDNERD